MTEQVTSEPAVTKQDVIDYVTTSPQNTNEAVLSTILDDYLAENGSGGSEGEPSLLDITYSPIEITLINGDEPTRIEPAQISIMFNLLSVFEDNNVIYALILEENESEFPFVYESNIILLPGESKKVYAYGAGIVLTGFTTADNITMLATGDAVSIKADSYEISGDCTITGTTTGK